MARMKPPNLFETVREKYEAVISKHLDEFLEFTRLLLMAQPPAS